MAVTTRQWNSETKSYDPEEIKHEGLVVDIDSTYLGDCDSAYYAVYFDRETATFKQHSLGYTPDGAKVDATEEVARAWEAEKAARQAAARAGAMRLNLAREMDQADADAATPWAGKTVRVIKGRKVPVGTEGVVKVRHEGQWGWSVLITTADGAEVWTSDSNVEVIAQSAKEAVPA